MLCRLRRSRQLRRYTAICQNALKRQYPNGLLNRRDRICLDPGPGFGKTPKPTREQIVTHMDGNLCRCGTYPRIVRAIERAAKGEQG